MSEIRCIVIDDEPLAVEMIAGYIRRTPSLELVSFYRDPVVGISEICSIKPDLVFLDIQMPDINGIELTRLLPSDTRVIFTTAFKEYALDSYEVEALDYLLKPVSYQKFLESVKKAEKWIEMRKTTSPVYWAEHDKERQSAFIKVDGEYRNVDFNDILYVAGMKDYVTIYTLSNPDPFVTHVTMKTIEELLPSDRFMRIHRSYIVSLNKITAVDSCGDILIGKISIPVSDSYRKDVDCYIRNNLLVK